MRIISQYLTREIMQMLLALSGVLIMIYMSARFVRYLAKAAEGVLSSEFIVSLLALKLVVFLVLLIPLGFFLSIILVLGRMAEDRELTAMAVCGAGQPVINRVVMRLALVLSIATALLTVFVAPWANGRIAALELEAREKALVSGLVAGEFREFGGGKRVIYSAGVSADGEWLLDLFIRLRKNNVSEVLSGQRGRYFVDETSGEQFMVIQDGHRYQGQPGQPNYTIMSFAEYGVRLEQSETISASSVAPKAMSMAQLLGGGSPGLMAEFQWRISMPIAVMILSLLAVQLGELFARQGRYTRLILAVMIYFAYNNSLGVARNMVARDVIPAWIGLWWVHVVLAALVVWLYRRSPARRSPTDDLVKSG